MIKLTQVITFNVHRSLYKPTSTIYTEANSGEAQADKLMLKSGNFDNSISSSSSKEVRPFSRHTGARGQRSVRTLGGFKVAESDYMKR